MAKKNEQATTEQVKGAIVIANTYGITSLDNAIKATADAFTNAQGSVKSYAQALGELKREFDKVDDFKKVRFPEWIEKQFGGRVAGQTAYKYSQIANAFSGNADLWDVYTLSKLSILLNCRTEDCKDAVQATFFMFTWYGDSLNRARFDRWTEWNKNTETAKKKAEEFKAKGDEMTAKMWRDKIKPEPSKPREIPENIPDEKARHEYATKYAEACMWASHEMLYKFTDKELSEIVKAYRHPDDYKINPDGTAEKLKVVATTGNTDGNDGDENTEKTPDELKADAYTALLAYVSALGDDAPRSLKTALATLESKES